MTAFYPRFAISMVISAAVGISSAAHLVPPDAKAGMHENSSRIKKLDADQDCQIKIGLSN
jgi:hypothetical protein